MKKIIQYRYVLILLLAFIVMVPQLFRGLFETSEGRYAMVARNMVETGNYLIPVINGKNHLTKPPLTYWVIALGESIFGSNTQGARFLHLFVWLCTCLLVVRIGDRLGGKSFGLKTGLIFSTAVFTTIGHGFLTTDPLLVFFQVAAFVCLIEKRGELFWLSLSLAFLTKGPVALFPLLFWCMFEWKSIRLMTKPLSVGIFLATSAFWYVLLELDRPGTIQKLFHDEIILRSTTNFSGRNAFWWAPLVTYLLPVLLGWGLWPFFLKKDRIRKFELHERLCIVWVVATLVIFSFIQSRLVLYILPLGLPVTLLFSRAVKLSTRSVVMNVLLVLVINAALVIYPYSSNSAQIAEFVSAHSRKGSVTFVNEYLYGVEYYLGDKFRRFSNYGQFKKAVETKQPLEWLAYQNKRAKHVLPILQHYNLTELEKFSSGEWNLIRVGPLKLNPAVGAKISVLQLTPEK